MTGVFSDIMIVEGDDVFILPSHSLKFAGRWGEVVKIDPENHLPLRIMFTEGLMSYLFDFNEVITVKNYYEWFKSVYGCISTSDGEVVTIRKLEFPYVYGEDMIPRFFSGLLPITHCEYCAKNTTGQFSRVCIDCSSPLPEENKDERTL